MTTAFNALTATDLSQAVTQGGLLLDVRTDMEHAEKHLSLPHAHVPLDQLKPSDVMQRHGFTHDDPVYLLCRAGKRAEQAAQKFIAEGYRNIHVITGGIVACEECGQPVKGSNAPVKEESGASACSASPKMVAGGKITLERQVRIAAGGMAAVGALLALCVSPAFALIPLAVGGGLVFAGVTDRCGLALMLTKAPWNKTCQTPSSCSAPAAQKPKSETGQSCQ